MIVEHLTLSVIGGGAGLALGWLTLRGLAFAGLDRLPRSGEIQIGAAVVLFTVGLSAMLGIAIGVAAAGHRRLASIYALLQESGRAATAGRRARSTRRFLASTQVAVAFILLVGAALLLFSFQAIMGIDPGFNTTTVTAAVFLDETRYPADADVRSFVQQATGAIRSIPGVAAAGAASHIPLGESLSVNPILAEGEVLEPNTVPPVSADIAITPGHFEAMGMRIVAGRNFDSRDRADSPWSVIVDESLARRFWPEGDAVGRRMYRPEDDALLPSESTQWYEVVGVAADVRQLDLTGEYSLAGTVYSPYEQKAERSVVFSIQAGDELPVIPAVRAALLSIDRELPLFDVRTMDERRRLSVATQRTAMFLALAFASTAFMLAVIGVYAVLAYNVAQQKREIGIRMALGSTTRMIFALIMKEGFRITFLGLLAGLAGAYSMRSMLAGQLYAVQPMDPSITGGVLVLLGLVALVACGAPALRASRINPAAVLNRE
jgi:putative ABC transport system permease protein